jgi:hypothetical protein
MLSTLHQCQEFKKKGEKRATNFFPCYDGPYHIIDIHAVMSNYTLELPNSPNTFPTFHASELKPFLLNDATLFPVVNLHNHSLLLPPTDLKNILSKRSSTLTNVAKDINILYDGLVMAPNTITGSLDPPSPIVKHLTFGLGKMTWA